MFVKIRCQGCGEELMPIPVRGSQPIIPSKCRNGHPTGYKGWWKDAHDAQVAATKREP